MENFDFKLSSNISLAVSAEHADKLLALCDGTCALLYLYALRNNGSFSSKAAATALNRTEAEITKSATVLQSHGLFSPGSRSPLPAPADELPEYTAEDIALRSRENGEFPAVLAEAQKILGKTLSGADVKTLFGIYDYLRLPAEVMLLLINHCVEMTRERSGPGRLPSMKAIEKEAYVWFNREILTLELAEEYLQKRRVLAGAFGEMRRILQINGRGFTATERQYVESWLEMGFDPEAIAIAYDRTVVKTGGLQWKYMNSIIASWNTKGLRTADEIIKGDRKGISPPANAAQVAPRDDSELLKKLLSKNTGK